jgi:hypothetical protein
MPYDFDRQAEEARYGSRPANSPNYPHYRNEPPYFSGGSNIVNERMIQYQKRQLPPLQRYNGNGYRNMHLDPGQASYWDEADEYKKTKETSSAALTHLWQKFIITFATVISLVCITWIAYNWNNDKYQSQQSDGPPIIEPSQAAFKILPKNPGGAEIPHQDKTIYDRMSNEGHTIDADEKLLPPQDEQFPLPRPIVRAQQTRGNEDIEEYSIVDDKIYYIKLSVGQSRSTLENEAKLLKKRYSSLLYEKSCAVKRVSNTNGELKYAVLIGPYKTLNDAISTARDIGGQCSVISVKE